MLLNVFPLIRKIVSLESYIVDNINLSSLVDCKSGTPRKHGRVLYGHLLIEGAYHTGYKTN